MKTDFEELSLCIFLKRCTFSRKNRFIKMQFLHILNSNFQPENARRRTSDLVQMKALNLSFHLVPLASWRTKENPRYKASKFANILNFVWALYGRRRFASNSRKKNCHNFSHTICCSHTIPIQNAFDHVTMFYNALCTLCHVWQMAKIG